MLYKNIVTIFVVFNNVIFHLLIMGKKIQDNISYHIILN